MRTQEYLIFDQFSFKYPLSELLYQNFYLSIPKNRWLGILGPSGIGKTTLLHAIARQLHAKTPQLKISLLPQKITLLPWLSNLDNVLLGDVLRGSVTAACQLRARDLLQEVGLSFTGHLKPRQLSGGQCQRIIIARTIYESSEVVLMDEPFASLDAVTKQEIQDCAQHHFQHKTVVLVTHDPLEALRLCDQVIVLQGKPVSYDSPLHLHSPAPRKLDDPEVRQHYPTLMRKLIHAKQELKENA